MTFFCIIAGAICAFYFVTPEIFGRHLAKVVEGFDDERARSRKTGQGRGPHGTR